MIDNITAEATFKQPLDFSNLGKTMRLGNLELVAQPCLRTFETIKYQARVGSLIFTVTPESVRISNSLHKYFAGNNYTDYSLDNLAQTIRSIEELTSMPAEMFIIKKLECSLNILTEGEAIDCLDLFMDYKNVFPSRMKSGRKTYGLRYSLTEYCIKIYSKSIEVFRSDRIVVPSNILRCEIQFKRNRILKDTYSLKDLKDSEKIHKLFNIYFNIFSKINLRGREDLGKVNHKYFALYFAGQDSRFWKCLKAHNINTAKSTRALFKRKSKEINQEIDFEFLPLLKQKYMHLNYSGSSL